MAHIEQRKSDIGQEIRKLEDELARLAIELQQLRTLLELSRRELAAATERNNRERSALIEAREKEMMKFRADFAYGSISRNILDDKPGPVPDRGPRDGGASAAQAIPESVLV
jgi:hypothetical protein